MPSSPPRPVALRPLLALALLAAGCAHAKVTAPETPQPSATAPAAQASPPEGALIPFRFDPVPMKAWGLRVERHRTLPSPAGEREPLHFDTEENSRLWSSKLPNGNWVTREVLTSHSESRNGDPDPDAILAALTGITVGMELTPAGKWVGAVAPEQVLAQLARHAGPDSGFDKLPPEAFSRELERDWRLGAEIYFARPIHVNAPVYSLLSVSLPQLPGQYVVVDERFEAPAPGPDGHPSARSTEAIFGRTDPRYPAALASLQGLMKSLGIGEDEILAEFKGSGSETVSLDSLQVFSASYQGEGVFPLTTGRGLFPLRFQIEEVAGSIPAPPLPVDTSHSVSREAPRPSRLARD